MTTPNPTPKPSSAPATGRHAMPSRPALPANPAALAIAKPVNPAKLLSELHASLGVTGVISPGANGGRSLMLKTRPARVTDAQIHAVISTHNPNTAPDPMLAQLSLWHGLTPDQKDVAMLTALKKLYGVTGP